MNSQPQPHHGQSIWPGDEMRASALLHLQWLTKSLLAFRKYTCFATLSLLKGLGILDNGILILAVDERPEVKAALNQELHLLPLFQIVLARSFEMRVQS